MEKTWKPTTAGILAIVAGVFQVILGLVVEGNGIQYFFTSSRCILETSCRPTLKAKKEIGTRLCDGWWSEKKVL